LLEHAVRLNFVKRGFKKALLVQFVVVVVIKV